MIVSYTLAPRFSSTPNIVNRRHGTTLVEFTVHDGEEKSKLPTDVLKMEIQYSVLINSTSKKKELFHTVLAVYANAPERAAILTSFFI